jgi:hypothetical protein
MAPRGSCREVVNSFSEQYPGPSVRDCHPLVSGARIAVIRLLEKGLVTVAEAFGFGDLRIDAGVELNQTSKLSSPLN